MIEFYIKPAREIYLKAGSSEQYQRFLISQYEKTPVTKVAMELLESYQAADKHDDVALFLNKAIEGSASLELYNFAFQYYKTRPQKINEVWPALTSEFQHIKNKHASFVCNACGYESHTLQWDCPSCKSWSSFKPV